MRSPKVSVCIPVYNGARYIGESLESVLSQTFQDLVVVVCDNCSTDGTPDVVGRFRDARLRYVRNPAPLTAVANHNRCLQLADTEYVCLWHHDDIMVPTNLERKVALLERHPQVGFVHSNLVRIDEHGRPLAEHWAREATRDGIHAGRQLVLKYLTRMHSFGSMVFIGAVVARRACYERVGGFREELALSFDDEMWMRMAMHGDVGCIGEPLVKYRIHPTSMSSSAGHVLRLREHWRASAAVLDQFGDRIPGVEGVRRAVAMAFWKRAWLEGVRAARRGEVRTALAYAGVALEAYPGIRPGVNAALGWGRRRLLRTPGG
jgi:glycosyltransferase involved in cell wall biosynthesis